MTTKQRWATMADVAKEAGVATITVSRVLRTPAQVSHQKRERVAEAIRKLGYVPDEGAGGLSSRSTRTVGALVSTVVEPTFGRTIDGLSQALRREGYHVFLGSTQYSRQAEEEFIRTMLARRPDGLVLTESVHTAAAESMIERAGIPVVEVWELPAQSRYHAVGFSNRQAAKAMTRHLAEKGRRNIGFLGNISGSDVRVQQRFEGYRECLRDLDLSPERVVTSVDVGMSGVNRGARELDVMLTRWPDVDAVFCTNDLIAFGALCEAQRRGIAVPDRLAIAGFGDFDLSAESGASLTSVRVSSFEIGEAAGRVILEEMRSELRERRIVDLGYEIVPRSTT